MNKKDKSKEANLNLRKIILAKVIDNTLAMKDEDKRDDILTLKVASKLLMLEREHELEQSDFFYQRMILFALGLLVGSIIGVIIA
jgi:hypothetical protein